MDIICRSGDVHEVMLSYLLLMTEQHLWELHF